MLEGTRILDLTRVLAGPVCTMMLGDLGADVIKIERPDGGDETRGWGPPFDDRGESAYFLSVDWHKLSVAASFTVPGGGDLIEWLATGAEVVVDNYGPATLEGRSLGYPHILDKNPALIWCTITGFGPASE